MGGGSADIGPDLGSGVASRLTQQELLEASWLRPHAWHPVSTPTASPPCRPMGDILTRSELRDLVEYLSSLDAG